ncbi:ABC transporter ATP-binding protein [Archangium violaceum]|uniref:ABC transporter ATP-binding protein n=1 Tax=Archangium violaceum TaxID=83451 RepID=UPI00193B2A6A|nr:ABC transporter ATP-binding protein [Archangium violaceum]QRK06517.1 ABC transporter ATP-binding protein [Archangium violaceum]
MIEIVGLHKSFGETKVLTGIDLAVPAGSTCVILGGSGSGKTVLMKHMIGLLKPDQGRVIVDGEDLVPMGAEELERVRRKFGMVFQAAALFDSMDVYENVAFPLREHSRMPEEEVRALVRSKLDLMGLPKSVESKFPADLSGGMRKRVGLARAIVMNPKIVLYDEPTTGLDPITTDYVDEMILAAQRELGITSVVISHDIASAFNIADQIAFLSKGVILEQGPPEQVRASQHPTVKVFLETWFGK